LPEIKNWRWTRSAVAKTSSSQSADVSADKPPVGEDVAM